MHPKLVPYIVLAVCLLVVPLLAVGQDTGTLDRPQKCTGPYGSVNCSGECVNIRTDADNCGKCGNTCADGYVCLGGKCIRSPPSKDCDYGFAKCNGECVNIRADADNCGKCGNACADGYVCRGGKCIRSPPGKDCDDGNPCTTDTWSRGRCVYTLKADGTECGSGACYEGVCCQECASCLASGGTVEKQSCCKSVPDFPDTCVIGACGCSAENSKETLVCNCGEGMCFDSETGRCVPFEPQPNCPGGCPDDGDLCTIDHRCVNGECVYDSIVCIALEGYKCCPNIGECVNTWRDENNCGECGKICPAGQGCCNGECSFSCPAEDPDPITIPSDDDATAANL